MKKRFTGVMMAVMMAMSLLLGGCSGAESTSGKESAGNAKSDVTTIKWAVWDYEILPYWGAMIDAFEAAHPDIKIEYVDLGSNDYSTVLATELSGTDTDFDIVSIKDMASYASLIDKKVIEPLDTYIYLKIRLTLQSIAGSLTRSKRMGKFMNCRSEAIFGFCIIIRTCLIKRVCPILRMI